jgi:hypothetical protein
LFHLELGRRRRRPVARRDPIRRDRLSLLNPPDAARRTATAAPASQAGAAAGEADWRAIVVRPNAPVCGLRPAEIGQRPAGRVVAATPSDGQRARQRERGAPAAGAQIESAKERNDEIEVDPNGRNNGAGAATATAEPRSVMDLIRAA